MMFIEYIISMAFSYYILRKAYEIADRENNEFADFGLWLMVIIILLPICINIVVSLIILLVQAPHEWTKKFFHIK